ncbi:MAG: glycosyltransferase involved in cell wall biosynthesis [Flavobacteriaceae bacterium]|jgi:glycosyltransferase involved in cell wall biosynthesis
MNQYDISIVLGVFNEKDNIERVYSDLVKVLSENFKSFQLIFVDDGSTDGSFEIIKELSSVNNDVLGIQFSRNFGQQSAITAGFENALGDVIVTIDSDGQQPPALIPVLFAKHKEGFDIVNSVREDDKSIGIFKKLTSKLFYKVINMLSDTYITPSSSEFRLMSKQVVDSFLLFKEKKRFTRGLIHWMGFSQASVSYSANERFSGKSKQSTGKLLTLAGDGITSFTSKPLKISFYVGLSVAFLGLIYAIYAVVQYFTGNSVEGWASLLIVILILGGLQLVSIGIVGEYLARVFDEVKNRPLYLIKERTDTSE